MLSADHALSPSTLAVRIAAAQRADPYAVVQTGFGVMSGALHGAATLAAESLLNDITRTNDAASVIGQRLRQGQRLPGFGHSLYKRGDPRGSRLCELVAARGGAAGRKVEAVLEVVASRGLPAPNVDFGLAALAHSTQMSSGASEAIISLARCAGWIAHALEEYARPSHYPVRAIYVGP